MRTRPGTDKDVKPGFFTSLPGNGLVMALMLAVGALVFRGAPLEGTRPLVNEPRLTTQDVDARLWQDPFGAVARAREARAKKNEWTTTAASDEKDRLKRLRQEVVGHCDRGMMVEVLAVMVAAGPYAEYVEHRRRTALVAAARAHVRAEPRAPHGRARAGVARHSLGHAVRPRSGPCCGIRGRDGNSNGDGHAAAPRGRRRESARLEGTRHPRRRTGFLAALHAT